MTLPTEDVAALVAELRAFTEADAYATPWTFGEIIQRAATALSTLAGERDEARGKADAYDACVSVARSRLDHIKPEVEAEIPALCQISEKDWLLHKEKSPICALDMLVHAERALAARPLEARATTAEAQVVAMREALDALRPFAMATGVLYHEDSDDTNVIALTARDLRRARAAYDAARTALLAGTPPSVAETQENVDG